MTEDTVDPFSQSPPKVAWDDKLPKLDPIWKGWQLFRGETWMEDNAGPIMFRWTTAGLFLIRESDSYSEDDLILVPPGQLCSCWRRRTCKFHRELKREMADLPEDEREGLLSLSGKISGDHGSHYFWPPFPGAPFKRCTDCPAHEGTMLAKEPCQSTRR